MRTTQFDGSVDGGGADHDDNDEDTEEVRNNRENDQFTKAPLSPKQ